jgi:uncharacterized membrane protein
MSADPAPIFEALIVPYRSLTRRGGTIVVAAFAVITAGIMLRFWLWGAWPVAVVSVIEVPLLIVLLLISWRGARASELIMLTEDHFAVIRTDPAGRRHEFQMPSAWLRVDLQVTGSVPHVILRSHGKNCEVGAFLHEREKVSLFAALHQALDQVKNPRFENPQLRDD